MSAATNGIAFAVGASPISKLRWTDDSRALTFLERDGRENQQLFRVAVGTHQVKALTSQTQNVFDYSSSGSMFAYLAGADTHEERAWWSSGAEIPDIAIGTGKPLIELLYPHWNGNAPALPVDLELWMVREDCAPVIDMMTRRVRRFTTRYSDIAIALSPDGTHVATIGYSTDTSHGTTGKSVAGDAQHTPKYELSTCKPALKRRC